LGLLVGACEFDNHGKNCWSETDKKDEGGETLFSLVQHPNFDRYVTYCRYKDFRRFLPSIWFDEERKQNDDPWWRFAGAVDSFNKIRKEKLSKSQWAIIDESMSAWKPRTTKCGKLPNVSFVPRMPSPLGTEFKCTACPLTGCMLALEIQRGKDGMREQEYNREYGNTAGCTIRLMKLTDGDGDCKGVKGDAWFGSVNNCVSLKLQGYESIVQIKQNAALFPKAFITQALDDAPGGVSIVLSANHNGVKLVATGYRYSRKTILFYVMTENAGSTELGTPYSMKYTDPHGNLCERKVDRPDFISRFFEDSNCIDTHNHVRQFELGLEKKWSTKNPYFRLCTTLVGMAVADTWKLATYHKLIDSKKMDDAEDKKTGIKKIAGVIAFQLIHSASLLLLDEDPNDAVTSVTLVDFTTTISRVMDSYTSVQPLDSIRSIADANHCVHRMCKLPKEQKVRSKRR
jgi:hypothetical protein